MWSLRTVRWEHPLLVLGESGNQSPLSVYTHHQLEAVCSSGSFHLQIIYKIGLLTPFELRSSGSIHDEKSALISYSFCSSKDLRLPNYYKIGLQTHCGLNSSADVFYEKNGRGFFGYFQSKSYRFLITYKIDLPTPLALHLSLDLRRGKSDSFNCQSPCSLYAEADTRPSTSAH